MSIRRWPVPASDAVEVDGKFYPVVTRDDMAHALAEAALVLDRCGGALGVVVQRKANEALEGHSFTTAAVIEWRDRTNAKPQPEPQEDGPLGAPQPLEGLEERPTIGELEEFDADTQAVIDAATERAGGDAPSGDGSQDYAREPVAAGVGDGLDALSSSDAVDESDLER